MLCFPLARPCLISRAQLTHFNTQLSYLSVAILYDVGSFQEFTIDATSAVNFMESVSKGYGDPEEVPYHNFYHAFSVMHVVWRLLTTTKSATSLTALDKLGICVAAVCHDMGHKGRNNQFHMNCLEDDHDIPELALTYNDVSVLEMYHASRCYQTLRIPGNDVFKFLSKSQRKEMRSIIIHAILGTVGCTGMIEGRRERERERELAIL